MKKKKEPIKYDSMPLFLAAADEAEAIELEQGIEAMDVNRFCGWCSQSNVDVTPREGQSTFFTGRFCQGCMWLVRCAEEASERDKS